MTQTTFKFDRESSAMFDHWHNTRGGRFLLRELFIIASRYGNRYVRTGQRVSAKLIAEMLRDKIGVLKIKAKKKGVEIKRVDGYTINNDLTAYIARFIVARRPAWTGMFEMRAVNKKKNVVVVVGTVVKGG